MSFFRQAWVRLPRAQKRVPEDSVELRAWVLASVLVGEAAVLSSGYFDAVTGVLVPALTVVAFVVSYLRRRQRNVLIKVLLAFGALAALAMFFREALSSLYDTRIPLARLFLWVQVIHAFDLPARKDISYSLVSGLILIAVDADLGVPEHRGPVLGRRPEPVLQAAGRRPLLRTTHVHLAQLVPRLSALHGFAQPRKALRRGRDEGEERGDRALPRGRLRRLQRQGVGGLHRRRRRGARLGRRALRHVHGRKRRAGAGTVQGGGPGLQRGGGLLQRNLWRLPSRDGLLPHEQHRDRPLRRPEGALQDPLRLHLLRDLPRPQRLPRATPLRRNGLPGRDRKQIHPAPPHRPRPYQRP